jgi:ADP-ribose pyrophosphatase
MKREYPTVPLVGVAGVVIRDGCVLMIRRGREPGRGRWSIPGVRLRLGETVRDGVAREVLEECGVRVRVGQVLGVADLIVPDDDGGIRYHYVLIDLAADHLSGQPRPGSDVLAARWVPFDELPALEMPDRLRDLLSRVTKAGAREQK